MKNGKRSRAAAAAETTYPGKTESPWLRMSSDATVSNVVKAAWSVKVQIALGEVQGTTCKRPAATGWNFAYGLFECRRDPGRVFGLQKLTACVIPGKQRLHSSLRELLGVLAATSALLTRGSDSLDVELVVTGLFVPLGSVTNLLGFDERRSAQL